MDAANDSLSSKSRRENLVSAKEKEKSIGQQGNAVLGNENDQQPITNLEMEETSEISKLQQALNDEKKKSQELSKRILYLQSDFVNLERQFERKAAEARDEVRNRFVQELISIKEDLERAMSFEKISTDISLFDGLKMLLSRIEGSLHSEGVERINASVGAKFDPRVHEAIAYSEGNAEKDGTVLSVVSNGYTMRGKVIKPALVEVSRQNASDARIEREVKIEETEPSSKKGKEIDKIS